MACRTRTSTRHGSLTPTKLDRIDRKVTARMWATEPKVKETFLPERERENTWRHRKGEGAKGQETGIQNERERERRGIQREKKRKKNWAKIPRRAQQNMNTWPDLRRTHLLCDVLERDESGENFPAIRIVINVGMDYLARRGKESGEGGREREREREGGRVTASEPVCTGVRIENETKCLQA